MRSKIILISFAALWLGLYTFLCFSPSSYGAALEALLAVDDGVIYGESRHIRSDEWSTNLALLQMSVLNDYRRFNGISIYGEDLRTFIGLPLRDWAIIFKPYFWPFFFMEPAYALSFYHGFIILAFLSGYVLLFRRLGFGVYFSAAGSLLLYYSAYVQTWWTVLGGPPAAGFPWIMLLVMSSLHWLPRFGLCAYVTVAWLLPYLYAPSFIALAFLGICLLIIFEPSMLRPRCLAPSALGIALGALAVYFYLQDIFWAMAESVYPGQRRLPGGEVAFVQWVSQLFPNLVVSFPYYGFLRRLGNVCEASTTASYLPLMTLVFLDYRETGTQFRSDLLTRKKVLMIAGLMLAFLVISAWQLLPIPTWVGSITMWNRFMGVRLFYISGFLLLAASLIAIQGLPLRMDIKRQIVLTVIIAILWALPTVLWSNEFSSGRKLFNGWNDLLVIVGIWVVYVMCVHLKRADLWRHGIVLVAVVANVITWFSFNPIQSTRNIFAIQHEKTPVTEAFDRLVERHPEGRLVTTFIAGAILGGLGYKSVAHILAVPQPSWFRPYFPDMPEAEFNDVFNRHLHIFPEIGDDFKPSLLLADVARVPSVRFDGPQIPVEVTSGPLDRFVDTGGLIERIVLNKGKNELTIYGWAKMSPFTREPESKLIVLTDLPVTRIMCGVDVRPDVYTPIRDGRLVISGFAINLSFSGEIKEPFGVGSIDVYCEDQTFGNTLINKANGLKVIVK